MIDLYLAIYWSKRGMFEERNVLFKRLLIEEKYKEVVVIKLLFTFLVIFISLFIHWIIFVGIGVQSIVLVLYVVYKYLYNKEILKIKKRA